MTDSSGQWRPIPDDVVLGPLLAEEELPSLQDGDLVVITWSGGNGPCMREVQRNKWGYVCVVARIPGIGPEAGKIYKHTPLSFVGKERYHTHVQRVIAQARGL